MRDKVPVIDGIFDLEAQHVLNNQATVLRKLFARLFNLVGRGKEFEIKMIRDRLAERGH